MLKKWKQLSSSIKFKNPWWTYKLDKFEIPGKYEGEYHYVHTNGSSMIVPVTGEGKIIVVNQYRYLCEKESLEFPCGSVKDGDDYLETARLELAEETGYSAKEFIKIGEFNPYNGVTDEFCNVFIAKDLTEAESRPDPTEEFEINSFYPEEIDLLIEKGDIWDGMTIVAWTLSKNWI
ncbi:MAG: NUDIX hydrolase [Ignavibacteria bacterium]|jgi:ADP-ribose pyrophosphatase